jgi:ankyrin repeat protein
MASDGAAPPPSPKVARIHMPVSGLEVGLLDVGRFVALSGYAKACRRLAFVARGFYGEDDYLVAGKLLTYGPKRRTRLMSLARKGDKRRVSLLLDVGANANAADTDGMTPLLLASGRGHAAVVDMLLRNGADVDAEDSRGRTALHHATAGQHLDVMRLLLAWSADVNAADTDGRTALHLASIGGHTEVVRLLLEVEGVDVDASDNREWTPLLHAEHRRRHAVTALLVGAGADLDYTDENMETVLGRGIARDDMESVRRLVALGAAVSGEYITYLHEACAAGNVELVRLLLEREKDDKKRDLDREDEDGWTPLHHAEDNGHHAVTALLVGAGASIDLWRESDGKTVLDLALDEGDLGSVRRLIDLGASPDAPDYCDYGVTVALHRASAAGNVAMVRLLLELGAKVDTPDGRGWSALLNAKRNRHADVVKVLIKAGADVNWSEYW